MTFRSRMNLLAAVLGLGALASCFGEFKSFSWTRPSRISGTATLVDHVDPFIGSSGIAWSSGHTSPAATVPFGMVKLGPDSSLLGKTLSHSGYAKNDPEIVGFSHTRYSGTGVGEGGILRVKPLAESLAFSDLSRKRYVVDKRTEMAKAGYYSVYLHAQKTKVELTAAAYAGVHRYEFATENPHLVIDLGSAHKGVAEAVQISAMTPNGFEGQGLLKAGFSGRYKGLPFFFAAELSHPIQSHRFVRKTGSSVGVPFAMTADESVFFDLEIDAPAQTPVLLKVGVSYTSPAAARDHLGTVTALSFDQVRENAEDAWQDVLERILVEGGSDQQKTIFYSALYRSFLMPTVFSDAGTNEYYGSDKLLHTATHPYYSDFSLWDTFRTVHPLYTLIAKDEHQDMLKSLLLIYQQSGYLTRWFSGAGHTGSMLGVPAVITLSEAYLKGLSNFDLGLALTAMQAALDPNIDTKGKECLRHYAELGYCPANREGSVSYTLEYAYGDHALSLFADARGQSVTAKFHRDRAQAALHHQFDKRFLAFLPKLAGGRFEDLGPKGPSWDDSSYLQLGRTGRAFVEGGARHWRFYSLYDVSTMRQLYGASLHPLLDEMFAKAKPSIGSAFPPYFYWHGNEPGFTQAYWYALTGNLEKTQKWVKWILDNKYSARPNGLDGDDDAGTLSAWYVFSAMGFFPVAGTDRYVVGYPEFDKVTIDMGGGKTFYVTRQSSQIQSAFLNGDAMSEYQFSHSDISGGGHLSFGGQGSP